MRFNVKAKLACAFGVVLLLSAIAGAISFLKLRDMAETTEILIGAAGRAIKADELQKEMLLQIRAEKNAILAQSEGDIERYTSEARKIRVDLLKVKDDIYATATDTGKKMLDKFSGLYANLNAAQDESLKFARSDKAKALEQSTGEVRKAVAEASKGLDEYVGFLKKLMDERAEQARADSSHAQILLMCILFASLVIGAVAATLMALSISRALTKAVGLANAVAIGDLSQTIDVKSNDEIGDLVKSLNAMTANLNGTAAVAGEIALGNLEVEAKRLSDKDTLGIALERMIASLKATADVANEIAGGNLTVEARRISDKDKLGIAFETMVARLRQIVS